MHTKTLFGTVAIAALLGTASFAQTLTDTEGLERLEYQMEGDEQVMDDAGNPVVIMADGTRVPEGSYQLDAEGTPYLIDAQAEADAEMETDAEPTTTATATAGGGEFIVEQEDPTVNVEIADPTVTVDQAQPEVTVTQPQPEITVTQSPPRVDVQQQAPIITVEQDQPVVTVRIPEPTVTIRMPQPDVSVAQAEPNISVEQPQPIVRFVRPEPQIRIEESEPQINVEQAEAQVDINRTTEADVRIEQADAEVTIEEEGEAQVNVETAEAEVEVVEGGDAEVQVEQEEAAIEIEEEGEPNVEVVEADEAATEEAATGDMVMADTANLRIGNVAGYETFYESRVDEIVGMDVLAEAGEDVGEVDSLAVMGDGLVAIVGVGGFLGLGEHDVALPLEAFTMTEDGLMLGMAAEELENMEQYDSTQVQFLPADGVVGDVIER